MGITQAQHDDLAAKLSVLSTAINALPVDAPPPPPPPPPAPIGTVSDLKVTSAGATVVTLSFTEVPDGAGAAANYDIRYAPAPITWGTAPSLPATLAGTTIGSVRSVTVSGLAPGTAYEFQTVAFRGTLNLDAVFGSLSNIAVATTTSVVAPPPTTGTWPNEPVGMRLVSDWAFDQDPPTAGDVPIGISGWKIVSQAAPGSARGWVARISDPNSPFSPPNVFDFVYPQGMVEGNAPATVYHDGLGASEVYAGFWWKPSVPFDFGPNGNKIAFIFNGGGGAGGQQFLILLPDGRLHVLPEYPGDFRWRDPNVNATIVTLGQWHRVEWYATKAGTLKWWLDGVLQGSYTNVTNAFNFDMFQFSPTWGGNIGARKRETDHYLFDHVHLSTR